MELPKRADLHRHLDGSLRLQTVHELGRKFNIPIPDELFFKPNMTLDIAISYFKTTLALLQEAPEIIRVTREICQDAEAEGVNHLEIRFGPALHLQKGLYLEEVVDAALEGANGKAGLILCGMYGDDPKLIDQFVEIAKTRPGVVAIDLADGPHDGDSFRLSDYSSAYRKAKDYGIHRTVHASEGRSPEEIKVSIRELHAERLGHASTLLDDGEALDLVLEQEVTIESCPTSNLQCGVVSDFHQHPVGEWLNRGVKVCLNTDNTLFSQVNSTEEHLRALEIQSMTPEKLLKTIEFGHLAAFKR